MLKCRFMEQLASTILKSTHGARSSKNIGRVFFPILASCEHKFSWNSFYLHNQKVWHFTFCFTIIYDAFFLHRWINIFICIYGHFDFADLIAWLKIPRYLFIIYNTMVFFLKNRTFFIFRYKSCFFDFIQNRTSFVFIKNRSFFQRCSALEKTTKNAIDTQAKTV